MATDALLWLLVGYVLLLLAGLAGYCVLSDRLHRLAALPKIRQAAEEVARGEVVLGVDAIRALRPDS